MRAHNEHLIAYFALLTGVLLVGCRSADERTPDSDSLSATHAFKVAILLPEPKDGDGWSVAGYEGLQQIQKKLGAWVDYTDNCNAQTNDRIKDKLRHYAVQGYDFVIAHGGQFADTLESIAPEFPRTKFALIAEKAGNNRNLGTLNFRNDEIAYLAGAVAALKTRSNKIAFIGGGAHPSMQREAEFVGKGARSIAENINVAIHFLGGWTNREEAAQLVHELIQRRVDVFLLHGDPATRSIHDVIRNAKGHIIAWNYDMYEEAPDIIVTSVIRDVPGLLVKGAALARKGHWEGKGYRLGIEHGVLSLAPFRGSLTAEQEQQIEALRLRLIQGQIDLRL